ncbi:hypothetical protein DFH27DRAFT_73355 [Peziza echinospora]|nr:hypothetical protein DFH27DRAFT_73355 [Peziza echinospora]
MSAQHAAPSPAPASAAAFEAVLSYNWDADEEFQAGIQPILASLESPDRAAELTLQAKCYFYSRKTDIPIPFEQFKQYASARGLAEAEAHDAPTTPASVNTNNTLQISNLDPSLTPSNAIPPPPPPTPMTPSPPEASASSPVDKTPYPTSFAHIVELIMTGQPIPGIREIPNKISEQKPSESVKSQRKKPWEINKENAAK